MCARKQYPSNDIPLRQEDIVPLHCGVLQESLSRERYRSPQVRHLLQFEDIDTAHCCIVYLDDIETCVGDRHSMSAYVGLREHVESKYLLVRLP